MATKAPQAPKPIAHKKSSSINLIYPQKERYEDKAPIQKHVQKGNGSFEGRSVFPQCGHCME